MSAGYATTACVVSSTGLLIRHDISWQFSEFSDYTVHWTELTDSILLSKGNSAK